MIDPLERWREHGEKPDYAACSPSAACRTPRTRLSWPGWTWRSSARPPTTSSPTAPARASGRARSAPRAARRGRTSRPASTASKRFGWSTSATRRCCPPTPSAPTRRSSRRSARCSTPGAIPIVLGGDHGIAEPDIRACAAKARPGRPDPLRHPHRHRHGGLRRRGLARHADVPAGRAGPRRPRRATCRSGCAATGRARRSSPGSARSGITRLFMHDVRELGIARGRRARASRWWATGRLHVASTSTCSTRRSRPAPARPSRAG